GSGSRPWPAARSGRWWSGKFAGAWRSTQSWSLEIVMSGLVPGIHVFLDQILPGDDFAEPRIVGDELLDELVHPVLEDVVHVAVLQAVADAAGVALRRALPAIGDADLVEVAHEVAVAARKRARQRVVQDQQIGDQPGFQGLAVDPMIGGQRRD